MTPRRTSLLAALAALALASACGGSDSGSGATTPDPREVVQAHVDARVADDCDAYQALSTDEYQDEGCFGGPLDVASGEPVVGDAEVDGDRATVPVTTWFACTGPGAGDPVASDDTYLLVLVGGEWLVDGYEVEGVTDDDCIAQNDG